MTDSDSNLTITVWSSLSTQAYGGKLTVNVSALGEVTTIKIVATIFRAVENSFYDRGSLKGLL